MRVSKERRNFTPLNSDAIANIITIYPDVDCYWLLTGNGQMLKNNEASAEKNDKNSERIDKLLDIVASQQKTIELLAKKGLRRMCRVLLARRYKDKTTRTIYTDTRLSDQRRGPALQPQHHHHDKTDYKTGYIIVSRVRRIT